jgi:DNA-binding transcriptional LysR family regulator
MSPSSALDLNLIRVFVAIYETGSASLAAHRLELTQPSVSHALTRLRTHYNDHLFARHAAGLRPTKLSDQLFPRLRDALAAIESTVNESRFFDPKTSERQVRIAMSDIGALYFVPPLLHRLRKLAPLLKVEITQPSATLADELSTGAVDLAVGNLPELLTHTRVETLFTERYTCLLSSSHPTINNKLSVKAFSSARHILVTSPWSGHILIDSILSSQGISRNIVARVPHFSSLPNILVGSDLLAILPSRVASIFSLQGGLKLLDIPVAIPHFEVRLHWHTRHQSSPIHQWLREQFLALSEL